MLSEQLFDMITQLYQIECQSQFSLYVLSYPKGLFIYRQTD